MAVGEIYAALQNRGSKPAIILSLLTVKSANAIVDLKQQRLVLSDWGLAEFYLPNKTYKVSSSKLGAIRPCIFSFTIYHPQYHCWFLDCTVCKQSLLSLLASWYSL